MRADKICCVALASGAALCASGAASADEWQISYSADVIGPVSGGISQTGRLLDVIDVIGEIDLETIGLRHWRAGVFIENTSGGEPNLAVGTLQGIDNIEVERQRLRLYEAWLERDWGAASLRFGLYDLNSEFNATDSAGLLLAPSFGISPEFSAAGPNGPSIFPSTALGARYNVNLGEAAYARFVVLNALAGVPGDPGGVDGEFDNGVLIAAEGGVHGFSFGAWSFSDDQPEIDGAGEARSQGVYFMLERALNDPEGARAVTGFLRGGVSDGDTTEIKSAWQSGFLMRRVFADRPESALSLGVAQAFLSDGYRDDQRALGVDVSAAETQFELTYSDALCPRLTIQPDLQYIVRPGGERDIDDALVAGLRVIVSL